MNRIHSILLIIVSSIILLAFTLNVSSASQATLENKNVISAANNPITIIPPPPLVSTPIDFMDDSFNQWTNILRAIDKSGISHVTLQISGLGGVLYYETITARHIDLLKAKGIQIDMKVTGRAVSANAYIVCNASSFSMDDYSQLYFHYPYDVNNNLFSLIQTRDYTFSPYDAMDTGYVMDTCIKAGILTAEDVKVLKSGRAVVITQYPGHRVKEISDFDHESIVQFNEGSILNLGILIIFSFLSVVLVTYIIRRVGK